MKNIHLYFIISLFLIIAGCSEEKSISTINPGPTSRVLFELTETDDNKVSEVDVLAFTVDENDETKEYFAYRVKGENIEDNGAPNKKQFSVSLLKGGNKKYRFVVLANCRKTIDALGDISLSAQKEPLLQRLISSHEGMWITNTSDPNYVDIPMWAESTQMYIADDTQTVTGLFLLRMLARIDVNIDASIQSKFKLKSVRLYNYNTNGHIVPLTDPSHWSGSVVLAPTIPSVSGKTLGPIVYDEMTTPDISITGSIYLHETAAAEEGKSSEATCLVIGGEYNNEGKETFYRVDLINTVNLSYIDILRNYLYNVKISNVMNTGHNTPEDAFNSQSINLESDITIWETGSLSEIVVDENYRLTISQDVFNFPMNQRTVFSQDNKLTIFTDHPNGWSVEKIVDENDSFIGVQWLTLSRYGGTENEKVTLSILTDANITEQDRIGFIHIKFGRIVYVVKVIQSTIPEIGLNIIDDKGNNITNLVFYSYVGGTVPPKNMTIKWLPMSSDLNIVTTPVGVIPPFDFGSGDVISTEVISEPSGTKTYAIQPPAMTQAEIDADPFAEKTLRVEYTVNNGVTFDSKSVFLQQKNLAAVPTKDNLYFMDGTEKFFTIRSNAPWVIEVTNDPNNVIEQLITTSGGYNQNKEEEKVYFRIANHMTNFSLLNTTVTFTIKSINPEYPLQEKQVTIYCLSAYSRKTLLTIGNDPNGYGYNFSGTAASNKLITTASNFGLTTQSTVKAEGFTIINGATNPSEAQMLNWLITNPVDIVITGFDNANISTTIANYYAQYLQNGGVVIAFQDRTDALVSSNFLKAILGSGASVSYGSGAGSVYPIANLDLEMLKGPFGDIRNMQWGHDASTTVRVFNVSSDLVNPLTSDRDISTVGSTATPGYMTSFIHKTYSLVWAGDGGFNSNNAFNDLTICPFKIDGSNYPIPKASYGRGTLRFPVYNSVFTANAIAWGIKQAEIKRAKALTKSK